MERTKIIPLYNIVPLVFHNMNEFISYQIYRYTYQICTYIFIYITSIYLVIIKCEIVKVHYMSNY